MIDRDDDLNGRLATDQEGLKELADDLRDNGLLHPITLAVHGSRFRLIAGQRRLAAATRLGWSEIAACILDIPEHKQNEIRFLENATRLAMSPVEEAKQLALMLEHAPGGIDEIAAKLHRRPEWVADRIEMINWPEQLMYAVHEKKIPLGAAKRLARIHPPELRDSRIDFAVLHGINVRTAQLWLTDSQQSFQPQNDLPLSSSTIGRTAIECETRFHCLLCREAFPLENTLPTRICGPCLESVKQVTRIETEQHTTPTPTAPAPYETSTRDPAQSPPNFDPGTPDGLPAHLR